MSAADRARRDACGCLCHESGPPDLHTTPGTACPCKPHRGMRFEHARMRQARPGLTIDRQPPVVCKVTRVAQGVVYYRTADGAGNLYHADVVRFAEKVGQVLPDVDPPSPEQAAERARGRAKFEAEQATSVRTTFVLSCGCALPESEPIPRREHPVTEPGAVTSCEEHGEYAVVIEVRTRLVDDVPTLAALYRAAGLDELDAEGLAEEQATIGTEP